MLGPVQEQGCELWKANGEFGNILLEIAIRKRTQMGRIDTTTDSPSMGG